jgi:hypothetical protein
MDPVVVFSDPAVIIAHWHNLQIVDVGGLIGARHLRAAPTLLAGRFPDGTGGLTFVRKGTPVTDKATREELSEMMKAQRELKTRAITVLEETGIAASALRTMIRTMLVISGNKQVEICATADEGVSAVLPLLRDRGGARVTRAHLDPAVKQVRAAYDKLRAPQRA